MPRNHNSTAYDNKARRSPTLLSNHNLEPTQYIFRIRDSSKPSSESYRQHFVSSSVLCLERQPCNVCRRQIQSAGNHRPKCRWYAFTPRGSETWGIHTLSPFVCTAVFSKSYCPYCRATKQLLTEKGARFYVIELDQVGV